MAALFWKKKQTSGKEVEKTKGSMSGLEQAYAQLLQDNRDNLTHLEENTKKYISVNSYVNPMDWMHALAICDVALESSKLDDNVKELYRQIYSRSWNKHVSMEFDDEDYEFWFKLNEQVNDRFIAAGHYRGYAEQADLYSSARRPYRNMDKMREYYMKGVELEDATSMGCYGYGLYYGLPGYGEENKEEGLRLINRSRELGYESADILLLHIEFYDNPDQEAVLKYIQNYMENAPEDKKAYYILADYYLRNNDMTKATEAMRAGIELEDKNCDYLYGLYILRGQIQEVDKNTGIKHLEKAYDYYVINAANFLGQYYYYANDENTSVAKSIEWHEKALMYYSDSSVFELGIIYMYNEEVKNPEKGMFYLDLGIEEGNHRAMAEKAFILLDREEVSPEDLKEAKELLEKAKELGNDYAPYRLGLGYERAEFSGEPDYNKALELYELAAERGNVSGMEAAGHYYRLNYVSEDENNAAKAVEYFNRAIGYNSNYSRVELALCYETGNGVEKDYNKAFELYRQAAENGYPFANLKMAYYYEDALGVEEDLAKALENFKIAGEAGMAEAAYNLGRYYKYAVGVPENPQLAIEYFEKGVEGGNTQALVEMALIYEQAYGGKEFDAEKAMEYMTQAAEREYPYAQYKVGYYHYYGLLEQDIQKGMEWFRKAYEQGYPYAALMIGDYYLYNHGGEEDYSKAYEYYKYAEECDCLTEGLGICYEFGFGVEENNTEAFKYYNLAAEQDVRAAKYRLGLCYKYGTGTTENLEEAYRWFSEAAEDEHFSARYEMAMLLLDGKGIAKNEEEATKILMEIAEDDHDDAQFELGNCYLTGRGVPEDETQAMYWYQRAADNGNEQAQKLTGKRERRRR